MSEHEPAIDLPAAPEAVAAPPFAAPPGERVPDFTLDRPRDPEWYKRAVFYEVLIRGFQDASGNQVISSQPVPDTPANRRAYGAPLSHAGKHTAPRGN